MATSTFRQNFRAGCLSVLNTYQVTNPTLLGTVYGYPPESYATPCAYVEKTVHEQIVHNAALRFRVLACNVVIVTKLISNKQATDEQDVLIDGVMDAFTNTPHAASGQTLIQPTAVTDTELTSSDGVRYAAAVISIEGRIQEGRL